jgi:hypothetical protein
MVAEQYQTSGSDWFTGPLTNDGAATISDEVESLYNQIWSGNKSDVQAHIDFFNAGQTDPEYVVPAWINTWPAHGQVSKGQDYYLAPFVDVNQNNVYEPAMGDYPSFCGDNCLLWIFNDRGDIHSKSNAQSIGVQIIATAYTFNDPLLSNRVYFNYLVANKGTETLNDTYVGWHTDFDMGNPSNDYTSSWVTLNAVYAENGDLFDETTNTTPGYGDDLAMAAFILLAGPEQDDDGIDNPMASLLVDAIDEMGQVYPMGRLGYGDGIVDNERLGLTNTMITSPNNMNDALDSPIHYYNRMRSIWNDGSHVTYGEDGQNANNPEASYMFPLNTDPYNVGTQGIAVDWWTEQLAGQAPTDTRAVAASGPFTFQPGEKISLDFVYLFTRDSQSFDFLLIQTYYELVATHEHFISDIMTCQSTDQPLLQTQLESTSIRAFPNPCSDRMIIQFENNETQKVELFNATGQRVMAQNGSTTIELNTQHLPSGLYSLSITESTESTRLPVIIQH